MGPDGTRSAMHSGWIEALICWAESVWLHRLFRCSDRGFPARDVDKLGNVGTQHLFFASPESGGARSYLHSCSYLIPEASDQNPFLLETNGGDFMDEDNEPGVVEESECFEEGKIGAVPLVSPWGCSKNS